MRYLGKGSSRTRDICRVYANIGNGICRAHAHGGKSAEICNFTSDKTPWLESLKPFNSRKYSEKLGNGMGYFGNILYGANNGEFFYNGQKKCDLTTGNKTFYHYNGKILIFPDMVSYDPSRDTVGDFGKSTGNINYRIVSRSVAGVNWGLSCIESDDVVFSELFRAGDGIKISNGEEYGISGFHTVVSVDHAANQLIFDRMEFGDGEPMSFTGVLSHGAPEHCDAACLCSGRVWVAGDGHIYASTINDECNWSVGGDDERASFVCDIESGETVTACVEYEGNPVFFSENKIYRVYGDRAANFYLKCCSNWGGVAYKRAKTVVPIKDKIFFVSNFGTAYFDGHSVKQVDGMPFELTASGMFGGTDGEKYYVCFALRGKKPLYVYDTRHMIWQCISDVSFVDIFTSGSALLGSDGQTVTVIKNNGMGFSAASGFPEEAGKKAMGNFRVCVDGACVLSVGISADMSEGSECDLYVSYDGGERMFLRHFAGEGNVNCEITVIPRHCNILEFSIEGCLDITVRGIYASVCGLNVIDKL